MAGNTLTFEIGGKVDIRQFHEGITRFHRLVSVLTGRQVGIRWVVEDLQPGSAVITLQGESDIPSKVEKIVYDYDNIGRALEFGESLNYRPQVKQAAERIKLFAQSVEYIRFGTASKDYTILGDGIALLHQALSVSIGAVSGRVQTLSNRGSLRFNLYDTIHDKAVACYLQTGQEELMREAWGRRARVSGRVSRESDTGRPVAIRRILDVEILEDISPGSYRLARGVVPLDSGSEMPEEVIRRLRDA